MRMTTTRSMMVFGLAVAALVLGVVAGDPGRLYVTGEGSLLAPFDMTKITLNLDVQVVDKGASRNATALHDSAAESLVSVLTDRIGIPISNISTTTIYIEPVTNYDGDVQETVGYQATSAIAVDIGSGLISEVVQAATDAASEEGVSVTVDTFEPYLSDDLTDTVEEELFDETMANAWKKAARLAKGARRELGQVTAISDEPLINHKDGGSYDEGDGEGDLVWGVREAYHAEPGSQDQQDEVYPLGRQKVTQKIYIEFSLV